jgi:hypothetical protein
MARAHSDEVEFAPKAFICPITCDVLVDPVYTADGMTYEREAISTWLQANKTSPLTNARLPHSQLVPNFSMLRLITRWRRQHQRQQQQKQGGNVK